MFVSTLMLVFNIDYTKNLLKLSCKITSSEGHETGDGSNLVCKKFLSLIALTPVHEIPISRFLSSTYIVYLRVT